MDKVDHTGTPREWIEFACELIVPFNFIELPHKIHIMAGYALSLVISATISIPLALFIGAVLALGKEIMCSIATDDKFSILNIACIMEGTISAALCVWFFKNYVLM
jgi:hypothetical protein